MTERNGTRPTATRRCHGEESPLRQHRRRSPTAPTRSGNHAAQSRQGSRDRNRPGRSRDDGEPEKKTRHQATVVRCTRGKKGGTTQRPTAELVEISARYQHAAEDAASTIFLVPTTKSRLVREWTGHICRVRPKNCEQHSPLPTAEIQWLAVGGLWFFLSSTRRRQHSKSFESICRQLASQLEGAARAGKTCGLP